MSMIVLEQGKQYLQGMANFIQEIFLIVRNNGRPILSKIRFTDFKLDYRGGVKRVKRPIIMLMRWECIRVAIELAFPVLKISIQAILLSHYFHIMFNLREFFLHCEARKVFRWPFLWILSMLFVQTTFRAATENFLYWSIPVCYSQLNFIQHPLYPVITPKRKKIKECHITTLTVIVQMFPDDNSNCRSFTTRQISSHPWW